MSGSRRPLLADMERHAEVLLGMADEYLNGSDVPGGTITHSDLDYVTVVSTLADVMTVITVMEVRNAP